MRALVTGASGFVGGHLVEHLLESGDVVVGLSTSGRWPAVLSHLDRPRRLEAWDLAAGAVADLAELVRRKQPEVIYHLAAQANPAQSMADPRGTWAVNVGGTWNLLEAVRASGLTPRVVLVGSGISYGNPGPRARPGDRIVPVAADHAVCRQQGRRRFARPPVRARLGHRPGHRPPVQPRRPPPERHLRPVQLRPPGRRDRADRRAEIAVGNLDVVRDFTDVRDIVRAYRLLAERGAPARSTTSAPAAASRSPRCLMSCAHKRTFRSPSASIPPASAPSISPFCSPTPPSSAPLPAGHRSS